MPSERPGSASPGARPVSMAAPLASMDFAAAAWYGTHTSTSDDWPLSAVLAMKAATGATVSVVIPARDEAPTIGGIVERLRAELVDDVGLIDELVVMDSDSVDETAARAAAAGASVHSVRDIEPALGVYAGKGEALWKSMLVTSGSVLVLMDGDVTEWGTHYVTGMLGPLLADPGVQLVKGFYDRMSDHGEPDGGRVTELVARPLISLRWPQLSAVVQPLAGEWAIRRSLFASLSVPVGYGVELAVLVDTLRAHGLEAIAQVDLGRRAHRRSPTSDLALMAAEIMRVADRRGHGIDEWVDAVVDDALASPPVLAQYSRAAPQWRVRAVPSAERPPMRDVLALLDSAATC
jgi:glucosyl-3-phosphoglycerate synthase